MMIENPKEAFTINVKSTGDIWQKKSSAFYRRALFKNFLNEINTSS